MSPTGYSVAEISSSSCKLSYVVTGGGCPQVPNPSFAPYLNLHYRLLWLLSLYLFKFSMNNSFHFSPKYLLASLNSKHDLLHSSMSSTMSHGVLCCMRKHENWCMVKRIVHRCMLRDFDVSREWQRGHFFYACHCQKSEISNPTFGATSRQIQKFPDFNHNEITLRHRRCRKKFFITVSFPHPNPIGQEIIG